MLSAKDVLQPKRCSLLILLLCFCVTSLFMAPAMATDMFSMTVKDDAIDDEAGQKDLNSLATDISHPSELGVRWTWDVTSINGNNTVDACAILNDDDDPNADYMVCVEWGQGDVAGLDPGDPLADPPIPPTVVQATVIVYECDNNKDIDNCANGSPNSVDDGIDIGSTSCTLSKVVDAFGPRGQAQADSDFDIQAECVIDQTAITGSLTNVCSYPSGSPTSDPSDCVFEPNTTGFLTVVKECLNDDSGVFPFLLDPASRNDVSTFDLICNGVETDIFVDSMTSYNLTETVPPGWTLADAVCVDDFADPTDPPIATLNDLNGILGLEIATGQHVTCTFTNEFSVDPGDTGTIIVTKLGGVPTWFFSDTACGIGIAPELPCQFDVNVAGTTDPTLVNNDNVVFFTTTSNSYTFNNLPAPDTYRFWEKDLQEVNGKSDFLEGECVDVDVVPPADPFVAPIIEMTETFGSSGSYNAFTAEVDLQPDQTVECTWVNVPRGSVRVRAIGFGDTYTLFTATSGDPVAAAASPGVYDGFDCTTLDEDICTVQRNNDDFSWLRPVDNNIGFDGMYQVCSDTAPICSNVFTLQPGQAVSCDDDGGTITCTGAP